MRIRIYNKGERNQLVCERRNGIDEVSDLGPKLPFHDIAHFVVERKLRLAKGFYGNIYNGYSVKQLSDKEIIKTLPTESIVSEVVTRALQSLSGDACSLDQFTKLIGEELLHYNISFPLALDETKISEMNAEYKNLIEKWQALNMGEYLEMNLEIEKWVEASV